MHIHPSLKLTAAGALSSVVAALALAGPLAGSALAAPPPRSPSPTFTQTPAATTSSTAASFAWTAPTSETFTCSLNGARATACGSGTTGTASVTARLGSNTFSVKGVIPKVGSKKPRATTVTYSWLVDTTPPQSPTVTAVVPSPTRNTTALISFSDGDPSAVSFTCAVDDNNPADATACQSPYFVAGPLSEGSHTAYIYAFDALNNRSAAGTTTWSVDTTAPGSPVFTSTPDSVTAATAANFDWSPVSGATGYTCSLDAATPVSCSAPTSYTGLSENSHTFAVQATDSAGNVGVPAKFGWTIDLTAPPAPVLVTGPATPTDQSSAVFTFADADPTATFLCNQDGTGYNACTTPYTIPSLSDGGHTLQVEAVDDVANVSAPSALYGWTVDTSGSTILLSPPAFLDGPSAFSNDTTPTFTVLSYDDTATQFECSLDSASFSACGIPDPNTFEATVTPNVAGEGAHVFAVKVTDGTNDSAVSTYTWRLDTVAPVAPAFSATPPTITPSTSALFSYASEADAQFSCSLDAAPATLCSNLTVINGLSDGDHAFSVTATDAAGNTSNANTFLWTVNHSAPVAPVLSGPTGLVDVDNGSASWSISDPSVDDSKTSCQVDGQAVVSPCSSPFDLSSLGEGDHTFTVTVQNGLGVQAQSALAWTVDTTPPLITVGEGSVPSGTVNQTTVTPMISVTDAHPGHFECDLVDGVQHFNCGPYQDLADGAYTLTITATDAAGNDAAPVVLSWTVDTVAPNLSVTGVPSGLVNVNDVTPVIDADGGTATCTLSGAASAGDCGPYTNLGDGAYTFSVQDTDAAGNEADFSRSFTVDTARPSAAIRTPGTLIGPAVLTWSEPVSGLDASKVSLKETDSGKVVTTLVSCLSSEIAAPCSSSIDTVKVTPTRRLVPGQHYTVALAGGAVQDVASNDSLAASKVFRAQRMLQESTLPVAVTWHKVNARTAFGHSYLSEHLAGAQATWTFRGTAITWWTLTGPSEGKAAVFVDGHRKAVVNNYKPETSYRIARTFKRLGAGRHVLAIRVLGVKGNRSATGTSVGVDAFTVGKTRTATPRLGMSWHRLSGSSYYGRHAVVANLAGEAISLTFRGTSIAWTTVRNRTQGKAAVYIDGARKMVVDNYSTRSLSKVRRLVGHLSNSVHTLRIVVTGKHHKGGKGYNVTVDRFYVG